MPVPSNVAITINGVDRTNDVLYSTARFDAQASAGVGTFSMNVRDKERTLGFATGNEVVLTLDGVRYFGGWLMQRGLGYAFPVVDTTTLSSVTARTHALRGVNYNALFDRLITNNPDDQYNALDPYPPGALTGDLVKDLFANYVDMPAGFDLYTYVDDVGVADPEGDFLWQQLGTPIRSQMQFVTLKNAAIYYFDAAKNLHLHAPETSFARWGFSDRPNNLTVASSATSFTGATYGFREMDTSEDISGIVNDIFVWGGSEFAGDGGTVFARSTSSTSIAAHGRWQKAEILFGDQRAGSQNQVDAIADAVVVGPGDPYVTPGTDSAGVVRNKSVPAWNVRLSWYAHDVPSLDGGGVKDHLVPGDIVTIVLWVHGNGPTNPLILTLPLRSVSITFPTITGAGGGETYVKFDGTFGLSVDDPVDLWQALLARRTAIRSSVLATASPTSVSTPVGALWQGAPAESANGTRTIFTLQNNGSAVRYFSGTSEVYLNALRLRQGADYSEQPTAGTITLFEAPSAGSTLWAYVRLAV